MPRTASATDTITSPAERATTWRDGMAAMLLGDGSTSSTYCGSN
jgi:hypothetical protein